jgi:hypothetical protein
VDVITEFVVVPDIGAEELLQGSWSDIVEQSDGFYTFSGQITQLAAQVMVEVLTSFGTAKAISEFAQEIGQSGPQGLDFFGGHP